MALSGIDIGERRDGGPAPTGDQLRREHDVMRGILQTSRDACWCIEYDEPVDLSAPESEILRQFFENVSFWRLCNDAMARLYKLPAGLDFNEQSVRFHFPHNADNEDFVRLLIEAGFNLDDVPSVDIRHDGSVMYAENDVRADIRDGMLHRMWGTVRDVSAHKRAERELARERDAMQDVLTAMPDPVIVIDEAGEIEAANPAMVECAGFPLDGILQSTFDRLLSVDGGFEGLKTRLDRLRSPLRCKARLVSSAGEETDAELNVAPMAVDGGAGRYVATLRVGGDASVRVASR